jgi:hypothetical protein
VFLNEQKIGPVLDFRGSWDSACDKAKIGKRLIHDMRRSAVRNMVESGVSEKVAMELSGHLTRTIFENYHIVSTDDLVKAVQKVSATLKAIKKPKVSPQDGIMPNVPFRSTEHDGDFIMVTEGDGPWPPETIHFTKPTQEQWSQYLDYALKKWGVDHLKAIVKEHEREAEWDVYIKMAAEKIEAHEKMKK